MAAIQTARKTSKPIQSVGRAMAILKVFDGSGPQLGIAELSRKVHLPSSTVYRLVMTLERAGFLEQDRATEKYQLGLELFRLGCEAVRQKTLDQQSQTWMEELAKQTREDVNLGVLHKGRIVYVRQVEGLELVRATVHLGASAPAHSTAMGKALLAWLGEDKLDAVIGERGLPRRTPQTITTSLALKDHLRIVREQGYAVDDEESVTGVRCLGAPVRNHLGAVIAAISVSVPVSRFTPEKVLAVAELVKEAANGISRDLGYFAEAFNS